MAAKTAKKARKSSLNTADQVMASEEGERRAKEIEETLPHLNNNHA
jgi:hypothetical protein